MFRRFQPRTPSVWRDMDRMQRDMNRIFEDYYPGRVRTAPSFPAVNIWADEDSAIITAELPGLDNGDIEINVLEKMFTLSGERKLEEVPENAQYHRQERGHGKFSRNLRLPYKVNAKKAQATFKDGLLEVRLPRAEEDKPKKIAINLN